MIDNNGTASDIGYPLTDPWLADSIMGFVNALQDIEDRQRRIRIIRALLAAVSN